MSGDHSVMRELNRTLVLDYIKRSSPVSRAAIARETSLAKPTVSAIVEELIDRELVREIGVGPTASGGGRPPILLEFNARSQFFVGVQFGIKRTNVVVADALGQELDRATIKTPARSATRAISSTVKQIKALMKKANAPMDRLGAVGVCVPGLIELETGECLLAPNLGWHHVPLREKLEDAVDAPVYVVNTADAAVVVETIEGAAQGYDNVVLLYVIGQGVGASVISEGKLLHGARGLVGEIGHNHVPGATRACNCGKVGCLETLTDGASIARAAVEAIQAGQKTSLADLDPDELTSVDVSAAAAEGDEVALGILEDAGRMLGVAASWLINLFNPDVLLVGGGVANAGEPLLGPLEEAALEHTLAESAEKVDIHVWTLGADAAVTGAVWVALQRAESFYRVVFQ